MPEKKGALCAVCVITVLAAGAAHAAPGDAAHGQVLYQGCAACHSIEDNDIGPRHRGVLGRAAGSVTDYSTRRR
jgi:cytochrome c